MVRRPREDHRAHLSRTRLLVATYDHAIPPHLVPVIKAHLAEHAVWGHEGLLFHDKDDNVIGNSSMAWHWNKARMETGLPNREIGP